MLHYYFMCVVFGLFKLNAEDSSNYEMIDWKVKENNFYVVVLNKEDGKFRGYAIESKPLNFADQKAIFNSNITKLEYHE